MSTGRVAAGRHRWNAPGPPAVAQAMELTCPKCQGSMRTYERNGVHVDQCTECRGLFLDRGELERLVDAETAWHQGGRPAPSSVPPGGSGQPTGGHGGGGYGAAGHGSGGYGAGGLGAVVGEVLEQVSRKQHSSSHGQSHGHRRKQSFLGELFG